MMSSDRWVEVTASQFPWEQRALAWVRERIPDRSPYMAWSNFEFLALDGGLFEVDLLVFSKAGVFLVEIKSWEGELEIGPRTWVHTSPGGHRRAVDNPYRLANYKSKKLRELLERTLPSTVHVPFIEAMVFLSESDLATTFRAPGENHVLFTGEHGRPSVIDAVLQAKGPGVRGSKYPLDRPTMKRFRQAMTDAEVEPTSKHKKVGDYKLGELFAAGPRFQDFEAKHSSNDTQRWARIFISNRDASSDERERLREAARREFALLDGLRHPGILEVKQHIADHQRPALLFEWPDASVRLDHLLRSDEGLTAAERFDILRSVAEAVGYAHRKRVFHRALSPESVLVLPADDSGKRAIRVFNWHTALKVDEETGTHHVDAYLGHEGTVYLAPEVLTHPEAALESADVFGLGALAFLLFTNERPARNLGELSQKLREEHGLRPSTVADGVAPELDDLVWRATHPRPNQRVPAVDDFLTRLETARSAMFGEAERDVLDPLEAEAGDVFDGRFEVVRRLGRGSTSVALLVRAPDGKPRALKISSSDVHLDRLEEEARALREFDHPRIVGLHEVIDLGTRRALVLDYAGETLRDRLRERTALSLDDQRRYGQDLCEILIALEERAVLHRDIKPANLGIATPERAAPRLVLFDFSLAGAKLESTEVGTPLYRDPFLVERSQWDDWADRWSASVTLYEIVTGKLPQWGDGLTNPAFVDEAELDLRTELFPAAVREPLESFFRRAFASSVSDRWSSALDMHDAWLAVFETTVGPEELPDLTSVTLDTRINTLDLGDLAAEALDRLDVFTVGDFLDLQPQTTTFQAGTSGAVRKKLRRLREALEAMFPVGESEAEDTDRDWGRLSIEDVLDYVCGPKSKEPQETRQRVARLIGLEGPADPWDTRETLADLLDVDPDQLWDDIRTFRGSWARKRAVPPLREDIVHIVRRAEGAVATHELAESVLAYRGSLEDDPDERLRLAAAAARVGVEAELGTDARLRLRRVHNTTFIATDEDLLHVLEPLGTLADELAAAPNLRSPRAAYEACTRVLERAGLPSMSDHRLLSLAAAASQRAALSARLEIYPVAMRPERTLALTASAFGKVEELSRADLERHVQARYPQAAPLPDPLELERLLDELDLGFRWDSSADSGAGAFVNKRPSGIGSSTRWSTSTVSLSKHELERQGFEDRLRYAIDKGGFMALLVHPKYAEAAADRLQKLADFDRVSLDREFVEAMHSGAESRGIPWDIVLSADAPDADPESQREFGYFLDELLPQIEERLTATDKNLLIEHVGLVGRWDHEHSTMRVLETLRDAAGNPGGPRIAWLVLPADEQNPMPTIDSVAVPIINASEHVRVPRAWLHTSRD